MKITYTSREFSKVERYKLTMNPMSISMKDVGDGTVIPVDGYILFSQSEETPELVSILSTDGDVYVGQSKTFIRSLSGIHECMDGDPYSIEKVSGISRNGRKFIDCILHE